MHSRVFILLPIQGEQDLEKITQDDLSYTDPVTVYDELKSYNGAVDYVVESDNMERDIEWLKEYMEVDYFPLRRGEELIGYLLNVSDLIPKLAMNTNEMINEAIEAINEYRKNLDSYSLFRARNAFNNLGFLFIVDEEGIMNEADLLSYLLDNNVKQILIYQTFDYHY